MNLDLTEEQKLLQRSVRDFADAEVKPLAKELDETGRFPLESVRKAAELGLTGISVPEKYGGAGMDHICYSIVMEEIARVCASTSVILSVQNSLYCASIDRFGNEEQKQKFLVPLREAKRSDATRLRSRRRVRTRRRWRRKQCAGAIVMW